ncbi:hypothetical protein [Chitinivorax sp. B]|uniref:hypothetical protein n=1 Tax=Chitinivorax sp. B TaxID=2502235 RepID=UPI0010F4AB27|nr:hypothetical protein [Chitinivorax sp. B]
MSLIVFFPQKAVPHWRAPQKLHQWHRWESTDPGIDASSHLAALQLFGMAQSSAMVVGYADASRVLLCAEYSALRCTTVLGSTAPVRDYFSGSCILDSSF